MRNKHNTLPRVSSLILKSRKFYWIAITLDNTTLINLANDVKGLQPNLNFTIFREVQERHWLWRWINSHSRPLWCIHDKGGEFTKAQFKQIPKTRTNNRMQLMSTFTWLFEMCPEPIQCQEKFLGCTAPWSANHHGSCPWFCTLCLVHFYWLCNWNFSGFDCFCLHCATTCPGIC